MNKIIATISLVSLLSACSNTKEQTYPQSSKQIEQSHRNAALLKSLNLALKNNKNTYDPQKYVRPLPKVRTLPIKPLPSTNRYDPNSLSNPYGAGNPYKPNGLLNPYSQYGNKYSNKSWTNPYATNAPKLYDSNGKYLGKLSSNKYDPDSISNPYGKYGNKYSPSSINNPYGAGNPYSTKPIYVAPQ